MWPVGIILYEILSGGHPFYVSGDNPTDYIKRISDLRYYPPSNLPKYYRLQLGMQPTYSITYAIQILPIVILRMKP